MSIAEDPTPSLPLSRFGAARRHSVKMPPLAEEPTPAHHSKRSGICHVKPRRPRKGHTSAVWDPTLDVFDDTFAFKCVAAPACFTCPRDSELLQANPTKQHDRFAQSARDGAVETGHSTKTNLPEAKRNGLLTLQERERRQSGLSSSAGNASLRWTPSNNIFPLKKQPRRRTIYVPSDDTTVMTVHAGASLRENEPGIINTQQFNFTILKKPLANGSDEPKKQDFGRRKSLAAPPRKAPLQPASRLQQRNTNSRDDVAGNGDGKENVPPGFESKDIEHSEDYNCRFKSSARKISLGPLKHARESKPSFPSAQAQFSSWHTHSSSNAINRAFISTPRHSYERTISEVQSRNSLIPNQLRRLSSLDKLPCRAQAIGSGNTSVSKLNIPLLAHSGSPTAGLYSVLTEHVEYPELYEDDCINLQEAAMTEIVNHIFEKIDCEHFEAAEDRKNLQLDLISTYHDPAIVLLHTRLQASLRFGALSVSKETLAQVGRLRDDLQQRQRFLDLWIKTYNCRSLQAAAEVVIGRTITKATSKARWNSPRRTQATSSPRPRYKALEEFLKTFLVRNEDVTNRRDPETNTHSIWGDKETDDYGSSAWAWRRTVVRSLMIILLLDRGQKNCKSNGCLFQPSSPFKSSEAVVQALGSLLLPSIGNIVRVLSHLTYQLSHKQYPMEECVYRVNNIAVDFRDGIFLARLLEILAQQPTTASSSSSLQNNYVSCSSDLRQNWALSQHLKIPCANRVQRLYNVDISLCALRLVQDFDLVLSNIKAEDIVDGHREKSINFLCHIIDEMALSALLDFKLVQKEISRLNKAHRRKIAGEGVALRKSGNATDNDDNREDITRLTGRQRRTVLLKLWAQKVARLRDVVVSNLSTSFADGQAYKSIVAEYSACITPPGYTRQSLNSCLNDSGETLGADTSSPSTTAALAALGFSPSFIKLLSNRNKIQSARTNVLLLTYLASHLLPASRPHFAAIVIQHAWRKSCERQMLRRRLRCAILARKCIMVVATRERIVHAAIVLQQWWRRIYAS